MSNRDLARRTRVEVSFDGTDITESIQPYLLSLTYIDNQEDETDDLQISLQDSDNIWAFNWLNEIVDVAASGGASSEEQEIPETLSIGASGETVRRMQRLLIDAGFNLPIFGADGSFGSETRGALTAFQAAHGLDESGVCDEQTWAALLGIDLNADSGEAAGLEISAVIVRQNWNGGGGDDVLETGIFELASVDCSGPPSTVKISASSLPFTSRIRQTKKTKGWEKYNLSGIANEMAAANGMTCMYLSIKDPFYNRVEQYQSSDIEFLKQLCHDAGCSLKVTNKTIVIFDQEDYEGKEPVRTIRRGDGSYTKYKLNISAADTQYQSCRVFYNDPATGACIEAVAYDDSYESGKAGNQQLEICRCVGSIGEALTLAEKNLRLHNKYARTVQMTFPGDTSLVAGLTVQFDGWGGWSGKYIITQAKHTVAASGYQTTINARRVLEGY